ncbi:MAG: DUF1036 domain-containing protein [Parvibaculaceae bacterium]
MKRSGISIAAIASVVLTAFLLVCAPSPARADYHFCNATSYTLQGAIAVPQSGAALRGSDANDEGKAPASDTAELANAATSWTAQGWIEIPPGNCAPVVAGPVIKGDYFVFARSIDAHKGPTKFFSGNFSFCTLPDTFTATVRDNCAAHGYDAFDFIRVPVKDGPEWTTTFGEPRDFSMDEARIAGAQRLLIDNGFRIPKIDGYAAKNTERAVMAFQRAGGRKVTGAIDDALITELVEGAKREQSKFGLTLCNKTKNLVWAAVATSRANEDTSSGWLRIAPATCAKAIKDKLETKPYYIYAEATDDKGAIAMKGTQRMIWAGRDVFCVKTTRFDIRGRETCTTRGYDERPFMKVETGGKAGFSYDLN